MTDDPPRSADLPAGYDDLDPYADIDLETLPEWWRRNIELFREHGLRPYRPARLADGELLPVVLDRLEDRYGVTITVRTVPSDGTETWSIWMDGDRVADVSRTRTKDGRSEYDIDSEVLEALVASALGERHESEG
ncbi:hypothetical protein HYG81_24170 (plasmid) [Natrinema zhouii]|uniref:hypothetical protein n=1 Tax=Natrinema zhouii TaxID=1710539 RepID=UPI001CFF86F5|nr:hypothetical protein [Natrinema zhouii]UHQ98868.1 hypothetical protein HYG81_24170 [Natrinema zhouii]